jgi:cytochrome oxidase Cu insertion factor (SCO1/SenC/PrrC family)
MGALLAISLLVILAVVLSACGSGATKSVWGNPVPRDEADGKPAPAFSGVTLNGKAVSLDQFRGKPLLLVYMTGT